MNIKGLFEAIKEVDKSLYNLEHAWGILSNHEHENIRPACLVKTREVRHQG